MAQEETKAIRLIRSAFLSPPEIFYKWVPSLLFPPSPFLYISRLAFSLASHARPQSFCLSCHHHSYHGSLLFLFFPGETKVICVDRSLFLFFFVPMQLDLKRMNIHASIALSTFPLSSVKKEIPKYFSFSSVPAKNKLQYRRNVRTAMDVEVVLVSRFITFLYIPPVMVKRPFRELPA